MIGIKTLYKQPAITLQPGLFLSFFISFARSIFFHVLHRWIASCTPIKALRIIPLYPAAWIPKRFILRSNGEFVRRKVSPSIILSVRLNGKKERSNHKHRDSGESGSRTQDWETKKKGCIELESWM